MRPVRGKSTLRRPRVGAYNLNQLIPPLSAAVLKTVRPAAGEDLYAQVPWLTSLWEARKTAAAAGKPILLWEMDGHPLGCG